MPTAARRSLLVVLSLLASLIFTAFTAPTSSAATEILTGSWGTDCATIEITSAAWPAEDYVHVRWYASATSATPGIDGEAYVPVNQPWSKTVDPTKVRGFSYRVVAPDGTGGWIDVTPLKDEAASCVVVLAPYLTTEAQCNGLVVAARNFGTELPYVITTKVNDAVVDTRTVTGDASFTLPFPYIGGSWTVDTSWLDSPDFASGIQHSEGSRGGCSYIPPIEKVTTSGERLEGASWLFQACAKYNNEPDWTCWTPTAAPDPIGWSDLLWRTLDSEAGAGSAPNPALPPTEELTFWETAAPAGYSVNPQRVSITYVCGGWHLGTRETASCTTPLYGFDEAAFQAADGTIATQEPVRLVNAPDVPVIHHDFPALAKVDTTGATVVGARVAGLSCTRLDNDLNWQCENLADYTIDPSDTEFLRNTLAPTLPEGSTTSAYRPVDRRIVMWETSAPEGYTTTPLTYAVDYACGAWRSITVTEKEEGAVTAVADATCDSPVLADNTFRWVNVKKASPTTPTTSAPATITPTTAPTAGALPSTGSNAQDITPIAVALLLAGGLLLGASRVAAAQRGSRSHR